VLVIRTAPTRTGVSATYSSSLTHIDLQLSGVR
jgi:hypothetical protein